MNQDKSSSPGHKELGLEHAQTTRRVGLRASIAREIAKDLVRRGWLPCFTRGKIGRSRHDPVDSVAHETWDSMVELLDPKQR